MRAGADPANVFDTLLTRDQIRVHPSDADRLAALADSAAAAILRGSPATVLADTREQVADLNAAIRERLVATGRVDDTRATTTTTAGARIGVGDRVVTRHNDTGLGVANRDTWTVTRISRGGQAEVSGEQGVRTLPATYVRDHLELGYASTVHGEQGETTDRALLVVGEHTSAASAYVGMSRGRQANTAHLVADGVEDAREQWVAAFGRDRADLGPGHAAHLASQEANRYAPMRPLDEVVTELHHAWTAEQDCLDRVTAAQQRRDQLTGIVALTCERDATVPVLKQEYLEARIAAHDAQDRAAYLDAVVAARAADIAAFLQREWDQQRDTAGHAAQTVRDGAGRLGQRRPAVCDATEHLIQWSAVWRPYLPSMPSRLDEVVAFARSVDTPHVRDAFGHYARAVAAHAHPDHAVARADAATAAQRRDDAWQAWRDTQRRIDLQLAHYGTLGHHPDPAGYLDQVETAIATIRTRADAAHDRVAALLAEPTLRCLPVGRLDTERDRWRADRHAATARRSARSAQLDADQVFHHRVRQHHGAVPPPAPARSPRIGR
jgi:hypothetical protein